MPNTTTPTTRPKATRQRTASSEAKRRAAHDDGVSITLDGTTYTVRTGDLTAVDTQALRAATGYSFLRVVDLLSTDPDIDLVAAVVWLAKRCAGDRTTTYAEVAADIGYDLDVDIKNAEALTDEETTGPEA